MWLALRLHYVGAMRKALTSISLFALLSIFASITLSRGLGVRLGAEPATLQSPYGTEEAWVVNEIVRDITEMSAYPKRSDKPVIKPLSTPGTYRVTITNGAVDLDLRDDVWAPRQFTVVSRLALGIAASAPLEPPSTGVHQALLEFSPAAVVRAGDSVSRALAANMRDGHAHEAAALTIGAFALRESAGRFSDVRWALNRMTAHLAMADVLNGVPGTDGRLAEAVLLTLLNRQTRALAALDTLRHDDRSEPVSAWVRALRMRITQDWRTARTPESDSLFEQREYFRARRATVSSALARTELVRLKAQPSADWFRLVESSSVGVDDGWLITEAFEFERTEFAGVFQRL